MKQEQAAMRRYAIVGLGDRHRMWRDAVVSDFPLTCRLVALCDSNPGRVALSCGQVKEKTGQEVPGFMADRFDEMIRTCSPDTVIVVCRDCDHDTYICRAMELGCDVVSEKPMTIDAERCGRILETRKITGRKLTVSFNYRYAPPRTQIKDLLMKGVIGDVLSVQFEWLLNVRHGADYFHRWHRNKINSGGLMVHKATHHFDLVNWWLSSVPEDVYAKGQRRFYTPETGDRYGLQKRTGRCHTCPELDRCRFACRLTAAPNRRALYLDPEKHDGYFRDLCVFAPDIDIEDNMNVVVGYRNGAMLSYSLNAFTPWEGYLVAFNGTRGRLEHKCQETAYTSGDGSVPGALVKEGTWTRIFPHWKPAYEVDLWTGDGGHGGADPIMLADIFEPKCDSCDPYLRAADHRAGAWSMLTGAAANISMREDRPVRIDELIAGLDLPDYPEMPTATEPLRMPEYDC
jgi:predicted dehydrogenase